MVQITALKTLKVKVAEIELACLHMHKNYSVSITDRVAQCFRQIFSRFLKFLAEYAFLVDF